MRTHKEWMKEMQESHDCSKCHGKIFCVSINELGITRCAYCNQIVHYPRATKEEIIKWIDDIKTDSAEVLQKLL